MSNTAHTREVQDLKNAGLNPILSAGGGGASTPGGASATFQTPDIRLPDFTDIIGLNLEQQKVNNQTEMVDIAKKQSGADIGKKKAETSLKGMQSRLAQKGIVRADTEGRIAGGINWLWDRAKESYKDIEYYNEHGTRRDKKQEPKQPDSVGGELP